jgi:hypothetical protein
MPLTLDHILFHSNLYVEIFSYFHCHELLLLETLNKQYSQIIRLSEPLWRIISTKILANKFYVRRFMKRLLMDGNRIDHRVDLYAMSIKELKSLANYYGLNITTCFEKVDLINVVNRRELRSKLEIESLAHFALRLIWLDRKRNCLTEEDLCDYEWNIRVRGDGPLRSLVPQDAWWSTSNGTNDIEGESLAATISPAVFGTSTTLRFYKNGEFVIHAKGPSFLDSLIAASESDAYTYSLEKSGTVLSLSIGVKEFVARHPENWGFVLQSQGTVWTNYPMAPHLADPLIEDEYVSSLVDKEINYGPLV